MKPEFRRALVFLLGTSAISIFLLLRRQRARSLFKYRGKSVVIADDSPEIGLALAHELLREGANVTLLSHDSQKLEQEKQILFDLSDQIFTAHCDIHKTDQLELALAEARARFGGIDVLILKENFAPAFQLIRPYFHQTGEGRIIVVKDIHSNEISRSLSEPPLPELYENFKAENIWITTIDLDSTDVDSIVPGQILRTAAKGKKHRRLLLRRKPERLLETDIDLEPLAPFP